MRGLPHYKKQAIFPIAFFIAILYAAGGVWAQQGYPDSLQDFRNRYIKDHEVIRGNEKEGLRFYPIQRSAHIVARFEKSTGSELLQMGTSNGGKKTFRVYGYAFFEWEGITCRLTVYQSQSLFLPEKYKDYLFLPFTDDSNSDSTYEAGRYLDLRTGDIAGDKILIDFNKAYNPYCAYVSNKYSCPIPPRENSLPFRMEAGEKRFQRK